MELGYLVIENNYDILMYVSMKTSGNQNVWKVDDILVYLLYYEYTKCYWDNNSL